MSPAAEVIPVWPLPHRLATGLVPAGSFALGLGVGVLLISAGYDTGSSWLGRGLLGGGYAAVGFPVAASRAPGSPLTSPPHSSSSGTSAGAASTRWLTSNR